MSLQLDTARTSQDSGIFDQINSNRNKTVSRQKKFIRNNNDSSIDFGSVKEVVPETSAVQNRKVYGTRFPVQYNDVFETRWKPNQAGYMTLCITRKSGTAHMEANLDCLDFQSQIHFEKKYMNRLPDNLCNENNFITGKKSAATSDTTKTVTNREPPTEDEDIFIKPRSATSKDRAQYDNLDDGTKSVFPDSVGMRGQTRFLRERSNLISNENGLVGYQPTESLMCELLPHEKNPSKRRDYNKLLSENK